MDTRGFRTIACIGMLMLGLCAQPVAAEVSLDGVLPVPGTAIEYTEAVPEVVEVETSPIHVPAVYVSIDEMLPTFEATAGEAVTLAVPLQVSVDDMMFSTDMDASGMPDQTVCDYVAYAYVELDTDASPLLSDGTFVPQAAVLENGINNGYAVFSGLHTAPDASPGVYAIQFTVYWQPHDAYEEYTYTYATALTVLPAAGDIPNNSPELTEEEAPDATEILGDKASAIVQLMPGQALEIEDSPAATMPLVETGTAEDILVDYAPEDTLQSPAILDTTPQAQSDQSPVALIPEEETADVPVSFAPLPLAPLAGGVSMEEITFDVVEQGTEITLPVAIAMYAGDVEYVTNTTTDGASVGYEGATTFDASALPGVASLTVSLDMEQFAQEDFPFALAEGAATTCVVIENGVNHGFAVFDGLIVRADAIPGSYPVAFTISWTPTQAEDTVEDGPSAMSGARDFLASLLGIATASADEGYTVEVTQVVTLESVVADRQCCVHCLYCFDAAGNRLDTPCACIDEFGNTACRCCEGTDTLCDCGCHEELLTSRSLGGLLEDVLDGLLTTLDGWGLITTAGSGVTPYPVTDTEPRQAIVFDYSQYKDAIMTQGIPTVYIGTSTAENTAAGQVYEGQPVNNGVLSYVSATRITLTTDGFVLDGRDPVSGEIATVEDSTTIGEGTLIYSAQADHHYTFRNLNWSGANNYGIVRITGNRTEVTFSNVTYNGPEMIYTYLGIDSMVVFDGCDITIHKIRGSQAAEEFMEGYGVRFTGADTTVTSTESSLTMFRVFSTSSFTFTVDEGTTVTLTSNDEIVNGAIPQAAINGHLVVNLTGTAGFSNSTIKDVTVGPSGSLTVHHTAPSGANEVIDATTTNVEGALSIYRSGGTGRGLGGTNLNISAGASVDVTIQGSTGIGVDVTNQAIAGDLKINYSGGSAAALNATGCTVDGSLWVNYTPATSTAAAITPSTLTVNNNATLTVVRNPTTEGSGNAITATNLYFYDPYRVFLYNIKGPLTSANPKMISTQCISQWENGAPNPLTTAYGLGNVPDKVWNNQGMGTFTYASGTASGLIGSKGVSPAGLELTTTNLGWTATATTARYAVVGQTALTVANASFDAPTVTGSSSGSGTIGYQYALDSLGVPVQPALRETAAGDGGYALSLAAGETWARKYSAVYVRSFDDGLSPWQRTAGVLSGSLTIDQPPDLVFEPMDMLGTSYLVSRTSPVTLAVTGLDTRGYEDISGAWQAGAWALQVRQNGPFVSTSDPDEQLASTMVFVQGGNVWPMLDTDVRMASGQTVQGDDTISASWGSDEGILWEQQPLEGQPGHRYTTTLVWTLMPDVLP